MKENEDEAEIDRLPVDLLAHVFFLLSSFRDLAQFSIIIIHLPVSLYPSISSALSILVCDFIFSLFLGQAECRGNGDKA